jgi:tetratricopeptide (TPR) repeat protein
MNLSYFGMDLTQEEIGDIIRPNKEDKHAGADELAAYACSLGLRAVLRENGSSEIVKLLLSNGLPVMMPTWHVDEKDGGMGHYRLVTGYSDAAGAWIVHDSLESTGVSPDQPYRGIRISYAEFDGMWAVMNRKYIVVYDDAREPAVLSILGDELDYEIMWQRSLEHAQKESEERPGDAFAWFTLGTNLVAHGQWADAARAYDQARHIGLPFRMLWYQFGPFVAYYETGRYDEVVALAEATLVHTKDVEEVHYWKGMGLLAKGDTEGALKAFEMALSKRPDYPEAAAALAALKG